MTVGGTVWNLSPTPAGPRPLFRVDVPLVNSPVGSGHTLFGVTADGIACAWDSEDGSRVWQQPLGALPSAPVAVHGSTVAVPLWPNMLVLLDTRTGAVKSKLVLGATVRFAPMWWQGRWAVVTRNDELVLASDDGEVLARQVAAGPVLAAAAGREQLWLACAPNRVTSYTLAGPGPSTMVPSGISMLHAGDDMLLVAGSDGELTCIFTMGAGAGIAWQRRVSGLITSLAGPLAVGTKKFWAVGTATGHIALLDTETGTTGTSFRIARSPVLFLSLNVPFLASASTDGVWLCPLPR